MNTWSFYSSETGVISSRRYKGPERFLSRNTPAGYVPIIGSYDNQKFRFDLISGTVVEIVSDTVLDIEST